MEKILTISIAAYNMEKYIRRTLDSLTDGRTIQDLEVFVIDDGGQDSTLEIAKEYAKKYPSSIFPVHKENGGYGTTVNYSIKYANGKYFKLLDGDDWFDANGLYTLVNRLKMTDCDIILTNYKVGSDENCLEESKICGLEDGIITDIHNANLKKIAWHAEITYRTELLRDLCLSLPEHMLYTDTIYALEPFTMANNVCYYDIDVYCYFIGREGQSMSKNVRKKHRLEQWQVIELLCDFYENKKEKNIDISYFYKATVASYRSAFREFMKTALLSSVELDTFRSYDKRIQTISNDIYRGAEAQGKIGLLLKWMRKSKFFLFYPVKVLLSLWYK